MCDTGVAMASEITGTGWSFKISNIPVSTIYWWILMETLAHTVVYYDWT